MHTSIINKKGQITIPAKLRHELDLHTGDNIIFSKIKNKIVIVKQKNDITAAFGMYKVDFAVTLEDMEKAIIEGAIDGFC